MTTTIYIGPPGTGKTTQLDNLVSQAVSCGEEPLICSLTRTAAAEVAGRNLPIDADRVGTLHSHAYRALGRPTLVQGHLGAWNAAEAAYGLSEGNQDDVDNPYDSSRETLGDELLRNCDLLRAKMVPVSHWPAGERAFFSRWQQWKAAGGLCDFTDLIERATRECPRPPCGATSIYGDEMQDVSALELELLRTWAKNSRDLIIVGDPYQALYVWRGAHPEMFWSAKIADRDRHVLFQSYRIPRAVHRAAIAWIEQLSDYRPVNYRPRDADGRVERLSFPFRLAGGAIDVAQRHLAAKQSVMIAASCSFLLRGIVCELRRRAIPFANPWRVKRGDWNPLARRRGISMTDRLLAFVRTNRRIHGEGGFAYGANWFNPMAEKARAWTFRELQRWVSVLRARGLLVSGAKSEILQRGQSESSISSACVQECDVDRWFCEEQKPWLMRLLHGEYEQDEALDWFEKRLASTRILAAEYPIRVLLHRGIEALTKAPRLYVGTIHSFKGAEADVVILSPDLSPGGARAWQAGGVSRDSVIRTFYVGMTRAREVLYVCDPASSMAAPLSEALN